MNNLIENKDIVKSFNPLKQKCVQKTVWIMDNVSDYPITKKSLEELDKKIKKQTRRKKKKYNKLEKKKKRKSKQKQSFQSKCKSKKKKFEPYRVNMQIW
jgi:hypothetical protein